MQIQVSFCPVLVIYNATLKRGTAPATLHTDLQVPLILFALQAGRARHKVVEHAGERRSASDQECAGMNPPSRTRGDVNAGHAPEKQKVPRGRQVQLRGLPQHAQQRGEVLLQGCRWEPTSKHRKEANHEPVKTKHSHSRLWSRRSESRGKEAWLTDVFILFSVTTDTCARPHLRLCWRSVQHTAHGVIMSAELVQEEEEAARALPRLGKEPGPHRGISCTKAPGLKREAQL